MIVILFALALPATLDIDDADRQSWRVEPYTSGKVVFWSGFAADLLTTGIAIDRGLEEANPLILGDDTAEVLLSATAIKLGMWRLIRRACNSRKYRATRKQCSTLYYVHGGVQWGAALWNAGQLSR